MHFEGLLSLELENGMRNSVPCSDGMDASSLNSFIPNPFLSPAYKKNRTFHRRCHSDPVDLNVLSEAPSVGIDVLQPVGVPLVSQNLPATAETLTLEPAVQGCRRRNSEPVMFEDSKFWSAPEWGNFGLQSQVPAIPFTPNPQTCGSEDVITIPGPTTLPPSPNQTMSPTSIAMMHLPNSTRKLTIQEPSSLSASVPGSAMVSPSLNRTSSIGKMTPPLHPNRPTPKSFTPGSASSQPTPTGGKGQKVGFPTGESKSPKMGEKRTPRGRYRCGRCGKPKANHVCTFVADNNSRDMGSETESCLMQNDHSAILVTAMKILSMNADAWADSEIQTPLISPSADCDANMDNMHVLTPRPMFFNGSGDEKFSSMDSSSGSDGGVEVRSRNSQIISPQGLQGMQQNPNQRIPQKFNWEGLSLDLQNPQSMQTSTG
mmetsp:Transcript_22464/g.29145  ORF Transcript_22464/g.29145 Transcript_22464/m.29145 type:complete len:430 (-) Transcript_22464:425-1714(-)